MSENNTINVISDENSVKWEWVDINGFDSTELTTILGKCSEAADKGEKFITHNGVRYKVVGDASYFDLYKKASSEGDDDLDDDLQVGRLYDDVGGLGGGDSAVQSENSTNPSFREPEKPKRKSERMFLLTNADGLTDFVTNRFYKVKGSIRNSYITVLNDNNEERTLLASRGQHVDVFVEPPLDKVGD